MKVLYVHHSGNYGGSSRSLGIALSFLIDKGIEPHIVAPPGPSNDYFRELTPNVTTLDAKCFPLSMTVVGMSNNRFHFSRSLARPHKLRQIKQVISTVAPDIVHCNELGLVGIAKIAKQMGKRVVMHARTMPHKDFPKINLWVQKQMQKYCDHTICITGSVNHWLDKVSPKTIVYNPIEKLPEPLVPRNDGQVVFLSLSAIQKSKGVFDIVEAARMLKKHSHIKIKIAGKLSPHNPADLSLKHKMLVKAGILDFTATNKLLDLVKVYKLDNLELLGHVSDVDAEIAKCDVVLAPMHLNAPPRSVYEAGIHGLPSILSMEDKVEDVIENDVNGILIDEQSPNQLADAILRLANDAKLRNQLGEAARVRCKQNHDPRRCADGIHSVYESVLSGKQSKGLASA